MHELRVTQGKKAEQHLCDACAKKAGIAVPSSESVPELIQQMMVSPMLKPASEEVAEKPSKKGSLEKAKSGARPDALQACPQCGMTYAEFRQGGQLGCAHCYVAFEPQLGPLLERWHEGGSHHVGKMPRRALGEPSAESGRAAAILGGAAERASRISALQKQLSEAVEAEQYERAAMLRDQIKQLSMLEGGQGARG